MEFDIPKARPIWQELPEHFKINVIKMLPYVSRCKLRMCSQADKETVDKTEMRIKTITLKCQTNFRVNIKIRPALPDDDIFFERDFFATSSSLVRIFSNPIIKVRRLIMEFILIPELVLELMRANLKNIKVDQIFMKNLCHGDGRSGLKDSFLDLLSHLEVKTMIVSGRCLPKNFEKLVAMDQWKKAKGVYFANENQFEIRHFLHLNSLRLWLKRLSIEEANVLIENFINKESFEHRSTFFQINTAQKMEPDVILPGCDNYWKKELVDMNENNYELIRVQNFKMAHSEDLIFVVKATETMLAGSLCRPSFVHDDFMDSPLI
ncbi:hypothetical protein CAEBREN_25123 [Caenorhabditis brenneri]|uniref:Uncharacterized protein n=1 Tax=Caenorhabditis brenneri TaxID=135651 RepID=G0M9I8_CAEBE|nr:hypothetical protein CAEBREN_25123 [Caenorhabditis brenneri]